MMKKNKSIFIIGFLLIVFLFLHFPSTPAQEVEDKSEFEYAEESEKGPSRWGDLKKGWEDCKNGKMQSPIDLSNAMVTALIPKAAQLNKNYKPGIATLKNKGHDIELEWNGDVGSIRINNKEYGLKQAHWHSPSEHTINGRRYDLELHMVHKTSDTNDTAVVSVIYKIGKPDTFLSKLMGIVDTIDDKDDERNLGIIDPRDLETDDRWYYRYMGSLTTPPCSEPVVWTINRRVKTVTKDQLELLQELVEDHVEMNARPLQPKNYRKIYLYGPATSSKAH